jgi:hypothetical protein
MEPTKNSVSREKSLNECGKSPSPAVDSLNLDGPLGTCGPQGEAICGTFDDSQKRTHLADLGWLQELSINQKTGHGSHQLCDPLQTGDIINRTGQRDVIYRYSRAVRGCDEAMMDLFRNVVVLDEDGKAHPVPITWGTQERAVAVILQDNIRDDNSLVADRIRLPILAIHSTDISQDLDRFVYQAAQDYSRNKDGTPGFTMKENVERDTVFGVARGIPVNIGYTLYAWTLYEEDMNHIIEQVFLKFSPVAYINVRGVQWEIIVTLESTANNIDFEPGDQNERVIKYQWNMNVETFIPQPITRKKSVLSIRTDFHEMPLKGAPDVVEDIISLEVKAND